MTSRRTVLKAASAAGAVSVFSGVLPGLSAFAAAPLRVRRSVNGMKPDDPDLATYRDFVGMMLAKPQTAPVSWLGFANMHGNANAYKYCPHGDWYFLPWHREYVLMYERAASVLMKNAAFAMPYWDWTALRDYPQAFAEPTYKGKPNPLYVKGRNALKGQFALTDQIVGPAVIQAIYRETSYEAFGTSRNPKQNNLDPGWVPRGGGYQGTLERTPHNLVHNSIGAFMPNPNSPRDPIFMMHHGNIDRIWAWWNALGRKNTDSPLWRDMTFKDNYIAPDGKLYSRVVKDLESTAAFGYTYDNMPPGADKLLVSARRARNMDALFDVASKAKPQRLRKANTAPARPGGHLAIPFGLQDRTLLGAAAPAGSEGAREIVALISEIDIGDNVLAIRVLVNHPAPSLDVPETDPHFVATIAFLKHPKGGGDHGGHQKAPPSAIVNLTEALRKLAASKSLAGDNVTVQLVPVPQPGVAASAVGNVVPAAIEIAEL
jgi:tyrosinase